VQKYSHKLPMDSGVGAGVGSGVGDDVGLVCAFARPIGMTARTSTRTNAEVLSFIALFQTKCCVVQFELMSK
jgi:hypothetical protein